MKTLLYTLAIITLSMSCRSIEKMVDRGEYDEAIIYATKKLAGKKRKKTKHVQGLEEAFRLINQRDLDQINYFNGPENPENWESISDIAADIARRQRRIEPFLPLVSKDGYEGQFDFVDTYKIRTAAQNGAAAFYYKEAKDLLSIAKTQGKKNYARQAFSKFEKVCRTKENYLDTYLLMQEAKELGIVHILIAVDNNSYAYLPRELNYDLNSIKTVHNSLWRKYHLTDNDNHAFDYKAILSLTDIDVSPERETITEHTDEKRVKDGWKYKKDKQGQLIKDSLGNKIKVDKFRKVFAYVTEIQRTKSVYIKGQLEFVDLTTQSIRTSYPLSVEANFIDYASNFRGDRRAVCDKDHNRLKSYPAEFPDDIYMVADAADKLKFDFMEALTQVRI